MSAPNHLVRSVALVATTALGLALVVPGGGLAAAATAPVVSDDFFSGTLDPQVWTTVDRLGDGVVTLSGAGTADARLNIGVPSGTDHNPWTRADVPRVVQHVADADLAVEVEFESIPSQLNQMQGLLFVQDDTTFVRFDVHRGADGLRLFASSTVGGTGKSRLNQTLTGVTSRVALRVTRTGSSWNLRWSANGSDWTNAVSFTQALTITAAGPFAGNAGGTGAAAFTSRVDYVFDTASPISPEDGGAPPPPPPDPEPGGPLTSDDFSSALDDDLWTVVDPVGGAEVSTVGAGTQDARLAIGLPAGSTRDAAGANTATRVLQSVADTDVDLQVKFDSKPSLRFQDEGLIVEQSATRWLRFSVYSDGSSTYAYASSTTGTTSTQLMRTKLTFSTGVWLRLVRAGDTWTFRTSPNGTSWTTIGSTSQPLDLTALGPYAGIAGPNPAWTALVDYVFDTAHPVSPEDGGAPPDTTAPAVTIDEVAPGSRAVGVAWSTNELATGVAEVAVAGSSTWTRSASAATAASSQSVQVTGLTPATDYEVRIRATDLAGNSTTSPAQSFRTTQATGPVIDVWHGNTQRFGGDGVAQPKVNLLGNVADGDGIQSLRYSVNGGPQVTLTVGPDTRRLQYAGDFNADIAYSSLAVGSNAVTLTAVDRTGEVSQRTVTVVRQAVVPSLPHVTDWTDDEPLSDQASVVDGRWTVSDSGVRVAQGATGYDRLIAIGDQSWTQYEVTVPFTVRGIGPGAGAPPSNEAMVGIGLRWPGHQAVDGKQPAWGYKKIGAYAWYRWFSTPRMELLGDGAVVRGKKNAPMTFGQPYVFKARADTVGSVTTYSMKMYPQGSPEPAAWDLTYTGSGPASGSLLLIAHHTDVTFGTVTVTPIP